MKQILFTINYTILLITIAVLAIFYTTDKDEIITFLIILGLYQLFTAFLLTIKAVMQNYKLTALYLIYWLLVILFFKILIGVVFLGCLLIAIYNVYVNFCGFSTSKYNILEHHKIKNL